jgi:hypothetical protein
VIVNVTKKAIWTRKAALPESTNFTRPSIREAIELFGLSPTKTTVDFPDPRFTIDDLESPGARDHEYNAKLYYPADVYRKPDPYFPKNFKIDVMEMAGKKMGEKAEARLGQMAGKLGDKLKAGDASQIAQKLGEALADAKTPFELLGILLEFGSYVSSKEVLAEIMSNAKTVAELVKKGQELGKLFSQAQASGDPIKQLQNVGKMLKGGE